MNLGKLAVIVLTVVVAGGGIAAALGGRASLPTADAIELSDQAFRKDDAGAALLVEDDGDDNARGDGDRTRGNDGTSGGNNTGDGDRTRGNDGTSGGNNTGDGDRTRGNDGTSGGDNTGGGGGGDVTRERDTAGDLT